MWRDRALYSISEKVRRRTYSLFLLFLSQVTVTESRTHLSVFTHPREKNREREREEVEMEGRRREVVVSSLQFACSDDISSNVASAERFPLFPLSLSPPLLLFPAPREGDSLTIYYAGWSEKHTPKEPTSFLFRSIISSLIFPSQINVRSSLGLSTIRVEVIITIWNK